MVLHSSRPEIDLYHQPSCFARLLFSSPKKKIIAAVSQSVVRFGLLGYINVYSKFYHNHSRRRCRNHASSSLSRDKPRHELLGASIYAQLKRSMIRKTSLHILRTLTPCFRLRSSPLPTPNKKPLHQPPPPLLRPHLISLPQLPFTIKDMFLDSGLRSHRHDDSEIQRGQGIFCLSTSHVRRPAVRNHGICGLDCVRETVDGGVE